MRIALKSDFRDYYDHGFEAPHPTHTWLWERYARGGLARPDRLAYLAGLGLRTPLHGSTRQLVERVLAEQPPGVRARLMQHLELVLSTDPLAHPGTPKVKMTMAEAIAAYPDHFAVEFIPANPEGHGESLRYLRIGRRQFWLGYASANHWRSTAGRGEAAAGGGLRWHGLAAVRHRLHSRLGPRRIVCGELHDRARLGRDRDRALPPGAGGV